MNQEIAKMLETENVREMAKDKINKRKEREEKKQEDLRKKYEGTIEASQNNLDDVLFYIISDIMEIYTEKYHQFDFVDEKRSIKKSYFLSEIKGKNNISDLADEIYELFKLYNEKIKDEYKKMYYFLHYEGDNETKLLKIPVVFDIQKMYSLGLFSDIYLRQGILRINADGIDLDRITFNAYRGELDGKYDERIVALLKKAYQINREKDLKCKAFDDYIKKNTIIIYKDIYNNLLKELSKKVYKDKYEVTIQTKEITDPELEELIELYRWSIYTSGVVNCVYQGDYQKTEILISTGNLNRMLKEDKKYGYLGIKFEDGLKVEFDSSILEHYLAYMPKESKGRLK